MESYDDKVYLVRVNYDKKLNKTKEAYVKYKYDGKAKKEFKELADELWKDIDHEYMNRMVQEQIEIIKARDNTLGADLSMFPDKYKLNSESQFVQREDAFADKMIRSYGNLKESDTSYLTQVIKDYTKLERIVAYYRNGKIFSMHTPSDYLSMLFNVNMRMASWNQTFKDGLYLDNDLVYLLTHPNACPDCNDHMGKIYSISGKSKQYDSIQLAYENGVGHPNCKCNFILYWGWVSDIDERTDNYEVIQKARGLKRNIDRLKVDRDLYDYIGNYEEADKTKLKISRLHKELLSLYNTYDIKKYVA